MYTPDNSNDLVQAPTFLKSPILTLAESVADVNYNHISLHDISDAYDTLSSRIQAISIALCDIKDDIPALESIQQNHATIIECLRRDLNRAFSDPFSGVSHSSPFTLTSPASWEPTEDFLLYAVDSSTVCHHALQVVSDIFRFPALSSIFAEVDILELLDIVCKIALSAYLPTPSSTKTRAISVFALVYLRLSASLISQSCDKLSATLKAVVGSDLDPIFVFDGLKGICNLLYSHPSKFLLTFVEVLPLVLPRLLDTSLPVRAIAAHILCGYVHGLLSCSALHKLCWSTIKNHIRHFIRAHMKRRDHSSDSEPRLQDTLATALSRTDVPASGQGQRWALVVLGCMILLSDTDIFSHSYTMKLIRRTLTLSTSHEQPFVVGLHIVVWKCLVWTFARLKQSIATGQKVTKTMKESCNHALEVVRQELRGGSGVSLISCLLSPLSDGFTQRCDSSQDPEDLDHAISILKEMIEHKDPSVQEDGKAVLVRLVSAVGSTQSTNPHEGSHTESPYGIIATELVNGKILNEDGERMTPLMRSLVQTNAEPVRPLTEAEIAQQWDVLLELWITCVRRQIRIACHPFELQSDLKLVWQALLLVQAQLTQEFGHLTTDTVTSDRIVSVILSLLLSGDQTGSRAAPDTEEQYTRLTIVSDLWKIARTVFSSTWSARVAGSILRVVLQQHYSLANAEIKGAWSKLCASLISADNPNLLHKLACRDDGTDEINLGRYLWMTLAETWGQEEPNQQWQQIVVFLAVPFSSGSMSMSIEETNAWEKLLKSAIHNAGSSSVVIDALVTAILDNSKKLSDQPAVACALLTHLQMDVAETVSYRFLSHFAEFLCELYRTPPKPLSYATDALRLCTKILATCPRAQLVAVVSALSDGLCIWIRDKELLLSDEEYNDVVSTLYRDILTFLQGSSFTTDTLHALETFLCSVFHHEPPPGPGLVAFREFWNIVRHDLDLTNLPLSDDFKVILSAFHDAIGMPLPDGVSYVHDSQSQSESQPSLQSQEEIIPETPPSILAVDHPSLFLPFDHPGLTSAPMSTEQQPSTPPHNPADGNAPREETQSVMIETTEGPPRTPPRRNAPSDPELPLPEVYWNEDHYSPRMGRDNTLPPATPSPRSSATPGLPPQEVHSPATPYPEPHSSLQTPKRCPPRSLEDIDLDVPTPYVADRHTPLSPEIQIDSSPVRGECEEVAEMSTLATGVMRGARPAKRMREESTSPKSAVPARSDYQVESPTRARTGKVKQKRLRTRSNPAPPSPIMRVEHSETAPNDPDSESEDEEDQQERGLSPELGSEDPATWEAALGSDTLERIQDELADEGSAQDDDVNIKLESSDSDAAVIELALNRYDRNKDHDPAGAKQRPWPHAARGRTAQRFVHRGRRPSLDEVIPSSQKESQSERSADEERRGRTPSRSATSSPLDRHSSHSVSSMPPCRRCSPGDPTSRHVQALKQVYDDLLNDGESLDLKEILEAKRIVNELDGLLLDKLSDKLGFHPE